MTNFHRIGDYVVFKSLMGEHWICITWEQFQEAFGTKREAKE